MKKILIVDDEPDIRDFVCRGLRDCGYECLEAADGEEAWNLLQNQEVHLDILDIRMPGLSGIELCQRLREQQGYRLPVIMLTALGTTDDIVLGLRAGADDYVVKPFRFNELLARIEIDESRLARYGVEKDAVQRTIEMAIGGKSATQVYEGERKFDLIVRYDRDHRSTPEQIGRILVPARDESMLPISELATIGTVTGPLIVYRENHERYCAVKFSVRDRDMGSAVDEARAAVGKAVKLPQGYRIEWSGDFENQKRASRRLAQVVPISLLLIFLILYLLFGNGRDAALVLTGVPAAAVGGLLILWITGFNFSISAGIGFICLFGICIQNGVIMLTDIRSLLRTHRSLEQAVKEAMHGRIRAILMTAMMATLGLLPAALSTGIGSESQRPLAIVIIGGLITATFFVLFVFPLLVECFYHRFLYDEKGQLRVRKL